MELKNTSYLLCLLALMSCNSDVVDQTADQVQDEAAAPEAVSKEETNTLVYNNLVAMTELFDREKGKEMVKDFRDRIGTDAIKTQKFPEAMIIERAFVENLLQLVDENSGGIIMYPVINVNGDFSLAVAAADFPVGASGLMASEDFTVIYPRAHGGKQKVFETINPVPPKKPKGNSGLNE